MGSHLRVIASDNSKVNYLYGAMGDVTLKKKATLQTVVYYKKYLTHYSDGISADYSFYNDIYFVKGKINDLWNDDNDINFLGIVDGKFVSGGIKLLYRLCSKAYRTFRRAVIL